jgi:hypothetical protein
VSPTTHKAKSHHPKSRLTVSQLLRRRLPKATIGWRRAMTLSERWAEYGMGAAIYYRSLKRAIRVKRRRSRKKGTLCRGMICTIMVPFALLEDRKFTDKNIRDLTRAAIRAKAEKGDVRYVAERWRIRRAA